MKITEEFTIKTERDFQYLMLNIDNDLKNRGLLIFQRPIHAWKNISSRFGLRLSLTPRRNEIIENCYTGDDLTLRIFRWYEEQYGERLKVDETWKVAILIKQDLYKLIIPTIYGEVEFIAPNKISEIQTIYPHFGIHERPKVNAFNLIENITPNLIKSFTIGDVENIMFYVRLGSDAKMHMEKNEFIELVKQAIGDIFASVAHLLDIQANYGLSKWSSLQATEKILKAYIQKKNSDFPKTHDLAKLVRIAQNLGLSLVAPHLINLVQCEASVRYGTPTVTLIDAVNAHHISLSICHNTAEQL